MNFLLKFQLLFLWLFGIILNIITFFLIYFKLTGSQNQLALKYNIISGVEWWGKPQNLYFFPIIGLVISIMNFALSKFLTRNNLVFLKELTAFTTIMFQVVILIAVIFLMKVN